MQLDEDPSETYESCRDRCMTRACKGFKFNSDTLTCVRYEKKRIGINCNITSRLY